MAKNTDFWTGLGATLLSGVSGLLGSMIPQPEVPQVDIYTSPYIKSSDIMLFNTLGRLLGGYLSSGWGMTPEMSKWFTDLYNWFPIRYPGLSNYQSGIGLNLPSTFSALGMGKKRRRT
ncbi:MAG: hypothetical protein DRP74_08090 [Candidatus Omnitrophota bacterium]|nr:MAG: hypothetical protein DRP74_08090 [Candidatus Omnitrophota bacterium]